MLIFLSFAILFTLIGWRWELNRELAQNFGELERKLGELAERLEDNARVG